MATPSLIRRLGDKAKDYVSSLKSLPPNESEYQGIQENQKMIDQLGSKPAAQEQPKATVAPEETMAKSDYRYGQGPGQKRFSDEEMKEMTHPLGTGPGATAPMSKLPSYDQGGEVHVHIHPSERMAGGTPVYDQGGEVDTNDGQHQLAVLQEGERVLTPEQNAQYSQEHGAPVDFGGRVLPNPDNVQVHSDTDPLPTERISGGAKMNMDNAPMETPKGDVSNPEPSQALAMNEASAVMPNERMAGKGQEERMAAPEMPKIDAAGAPMPNVGQAAPPPEPLHPDTHALLTAQRAMLTKEVQDATAKGDLATAGTAKLALLELNKANPYGSENNHSGVLGKIGHVLGRIGNTALDVAAPSVAELIPGTDLNRHIQEGTAKKEIAQGEQQRVQEADVAEKEAMARNAGIGKTPQERTYQDLLHGGPNGTPKNNPDTNTPYDSQTALLASQGTGKGVDEETIQSLMKTENPDTGKPYTRLEADQAVLTMKAGTKPANPKLQELTDYMHAHNLADTPANRDLARVEVEKRNTEAKAEAALPTAEHKIRLQAQLTAANQDLNANHADALQRGKAADEFLQKENARHNMRVTQIDSAQNALDMSDTNMLAASITPILATMTETTAQGIKRLNPQELNRFMPKSSGDAKQWFAAHYDQLVAGQIPETYRSDLRELLNNMSQEEKTQYDANVASIDQTVGRGAATPKVTPEGKTAGATPRKPAAPTNVPTAQNNKYHMSGAKGEIVSNDGKTWYTLDGKQVGK